MLKRYEENDIRDIAAAIKSKSGNDAKMRVSDMADRIRAIPTGNNYTPTYEDKVVTPSKDVQMVAPSSGYDALKTVTVKPIPPEYVIPSGSKTLNSNGVYVVSGFENVIVDVQVSNPMSGTIDSARLDAIYERS